MNLEEQARELVMRHGVGPEDDATGLVKGIVALVDSAAPDDEGLRTALTEMVAAFDDLRGQTLWVNDDGKGTVQRLRTAHEAAARALASTKAPS